eukprot:90179-Rhodomonas_salina.1
MWGSGGRVGKCGGGRTCDPTPLRNDRSWRREPAERGGILGSTQSIGGRDCLSPAALGRGPPPALSHRVCLRRAGVLARACADAARGRAGTRPSTCGASQRRVDRPRTARRRLMREQEDGRRWSAISQRDGLPARRWEREGRRAREEGGAGGRESLRMVMRRREGEEGGRGGRERRERERKHSRVCGGA